MSLYLTTYCNARLSLNISLLQKALGLCWAMERKGKQCCPLNLKLIVSAKYSGTWNRIGEEKGSDREEERAQGGEWGERD